MKEVKISSERLENLKKLFAGFSDEQIYELALGEEEKIAFNKYADVNLSPEEMRVKREELVNEKRRLTAIFECSYFGGSISWLSPFFNVNGLLLQALLREDCPQLSYKDIRRWANSSGQLQGKLKFLENKIRNGREIKDLSALSERLTDKYAAVAENIRVVKEPLCVKIYPSLAGTFDVYKTFHKNSEDSIEAVVLNKNSAFIFRETIMEYDRSYFSLGLKGEDFWVAVSVLPNNSAIKSNARAQIVFIDSDCIYIDDLGKYTDTSELTRGLKS